jgi:hypothetical protein
MMKKLLIIAAFLSACGDSDLGKRPKYVLPEEKMIPILVDLHMAESEKQLTGGDFADTARTDTISFYKIFAKNKITKAEYDSSMMYYSKRPEMLDAIYDEVINELSRMQAENSD